MEKVNIEELIKLMHEIVNKADDTLWIGNDTLWIGNVTVFERLSEIVCDHGGEKLLEKEFPDYF